MNTDFVYYSTKVLKSLVRKLRISLKCDFFSFNVVFSKAVRSKTVETVLGTLINFTNMKRVNTQVIKNANKHVLMASLTYNLKKYLRFIAKKPSIITQVVSLKQGKHNAFFKTLFLDIKSFIVRHSNFEIVAVN